MQVTINVEGPWEQILRNVSERIGSTDFEEVFGISLGLADAITHHLAEEGATVELHSPTRGPSTLDPGELQGRPGLPPESVLR
jgi:hypothetical protein